MGRIDIRFMFCGAALLVGAWSDGYVQDRMQPRLGPPHTARFSGTVLGDVRPGANGASSFAFGIDGGPAVLVDATVAAPPTGAHVRLRGRLEPFDGVRNPDEPAERDVEAERGLVGRIARAQVLAVLPPRNDLRALLARARGWALRAVRERIPEPDASVIAGALWGERAALPPDLRAEFQETGTVHVLVTAGLHLGVVVALVLGLCAAARIPRTWSAIAGVVAAWGYATLAGGHVPAMRAATMLTVALAARAAGRKASSWNAFFIAAVAVALWRPRDVTGASFLLSFSCVGAILSLARPIERAIAAQGALPKRLR